MFTPRVWQKMERPKEALAHCTVTHSGGAYGKLLSQSFYWRTTEEVMTNPEVREESFNVLLDNLGIKRVNIVSVELKPVPVILPLSNDGVSIGLAGETLEASS